MNAVNIPGLRRHLPDYLNKYELQETIKTLSAKHDAPRLLFVLTEKMDTNGVGRKD